MAVKDGGSLLPGFQSCPNINPNNKCSKFGPQPMLLILYHTSQYGHIFRTDMGSGTETPPEIYRLGYRPVSGFFSNIGNYFAFWSVNVYRTGTENLVFFPLFSFELSVCVSPHVVKAPKFLISSSVNPHHKKKKKKREREMQQIYVNVIISSPLGFGL
jgi:hypothetical protein